ncbi:NADH:flavin oxidoreductase [Bythopirellula polymerisocia]|uniref:NADH oxidase n=1 Tax=Bythopirellula polymerisocia TaxID=2528003 RepID=A0A5C6D1F9_9BACT|nr:NADH:flavin oxidoreductase [Bythopirellula polymerisocia]TWU29581.1 NADH oxidase [Bythopirellula polymerisocia]
MEVPSYTKIAQLRTVEQLRERLTQLGVELPVDETCLTVDSGSPLANPIRVGDYEVGNRWCIHPMEGWDANADGSPSEYTLRRWRRFGQSGAKLIWGGEAAAVQPDGRANPNQTLATESNRAGLTALLAEVHAGHREQTGSLDGLLVGLQLTHSGRFSKPHDKKKFEPRIAYHHPLLDDKYGLDFEDDSIVWKDDDLEKLIDSYVTAARLAHEVGYQFVDVKACHGYLLHEFLSARRRPGKFGGDLEGRSRMLLEIIRRVRHEVPGLMVGVRLSIFDFAPYRTSREVGQPMDFTELLPYDCGFGVDAENPLDYDLTEPFQLMRMLVDAGVATINLSCGSPYYNPHIQRPAIFPPSDGYLPPEDPLVGVWRQIDVVRQCKAAVGDVPLVGTGYSYLQDYLPHVAQAVVRAGWVDFVGLGRMVLSYPEMPQDVLIHGKLTRKLVCRTFSDCTTAPRHGLVSGCYPLDEYYKRLPEREQLVEIKKSLDG